MIYEVKGQPEVLQHPEWLNLAARACKACSLPMTAVKFIGDISLSDQTFIIVGCEDEHPKALMVCELPTPFALLPTILLAYNEGSKKLRAQMFCLIQRWCRAHGYVDVQMVNRSGAADEVYARALRPLGEVIGQHTLFSVKLRQEGDEGAEVLTDGGLGLGATGGASAPM